MLSRLYDHILNESYSWYKPNSEQAGYRKGRMVRHPLFGLLIIIHYVKCFGKDVFIGLLDFEKAFDYTFDYGRYWKKDDRCD